MLSDHELPETALVLEPRAVYDKAIVGYTDEAVVYDYDAVVEAGTEIYDTYQDSLEWHDFNTFSFYMGEGTPIFITTINEEEEE